MPIRFANHFYTESFSSTPDAELQSMIIRLQRTLDETHWSIDRHLAEAALQRSVAVECEALQGTDAPRLQQALQELTAENRRLQTAASARWSAASRLRGALRTQQERTDEVKEELSNARRKLEQENARLRKSCMAMQMRLLGSQHVQRLRSQRRESGSPRACASVGLPEAACEETPATLTSSAASPSVGPGLRGPALSMIWGGPSAPGPSAATPASGGRSPSRGRPDVVRNRPAGATPNLLPHGRVGCGDAVPAWPCMHHGASLPATGAESLEQGLPVARGFAGHREAARFDMAGDPSPFSEMASAAAARCTVACGRTAVEMACEDSLEAEAEAEAEAAAASSAAASSFSDFCSSAGGLADFELVAAESTSTRASDRGGWATCGLMPTRAWADGDDVAAQQCRAAQQLVKVSQEALELTASSLARSHNAGSAEPRAAPRAPDGEVDRAGKEAEFWPLTMPVGVGSAMVSGPVSDCAHMAARSGGDSPLPWFEDWCRRTLQERSVS